MSNPNVFCLVHLPASWATQTRENIPLVCTMLPFLPCTILKVKHIKWEEAPPHHPIFYIYSVKKKITYKLKWTWTLEKSAARTPALVGAPNPWQVTPETGQDRSCLPCKSPLKAGKKGVPWEKKGHFISPWCFTEETSYKLPWLMS